MTGLTSATGGRTLAGVWSQRSVVDYGLARRATLESLLGGGATLSSWRDDACDADSVEVVRAGLMSVRPGQMRAGLVLGLTRWQVIRTIILPQALIRMLPAFGSLAVIAVKDSSIAAVIAVPEVLRQSQIVAQESFRRHRT